MFSRRIMPLFLVLCLVVPAAVQAQEELNDYLLKIMFPNVHGKITVEKAIANWKDPVVLKGMKVYDPEGSLIFETDEFALTKSLTQLAIAGKDRGPVKLVNPRAYVLLHEKGCNFIDVLGDWYAQESKGKTVEDLQVEIINGYLHLIDAVNGQQYIFNPLNFSFMPGKENPKDRVLRASVAFPQEQLTLAAAGRLDAKEKAFYLKQSELKHELLRLGLQLKGSFNAPESRATVLLEGAWDYDLQIAQELLRAEGMDVELVGRGPQPVQIEVRVGEIISHLVGLDEVIKQVQEFDPEKLMSYLSVPEENALPPPPEPEVPAEEWHFLDSVEVTLGVAMQGARVKGFVAGPAEIPLQLKRGWLLIPPTAISLNDGTLNVGGGIYLKNGRPELALLQGPLMENVLLTPQMCHRFLWTVAPILADAGETAGRFSLYLDRCWVPLGEWEEAEVTGQLHVHGIVMDLNDGVWRKITTILGVGPQVRLLDNSVVNFHMDKGRMFHEGLGFVLGENELYTEGYVGLIDHTLDMLVQMTFPLSWLPNGPIGQRLKGTTVRIPIRGTFDKPKLEMPDVEGMNLQGLANGNGPLSNLLDRFESGEPLIQPRDGGLLDRIRDRREGRRRFRGR